MLRDMQKVQERGSLSAKGEDNASGMANGNLAGGKTMERV
jgi:hypothetical protein